MRQLAAARFPSAGPAVRRFAGSLTLVTATMACADPATLPDLQPAMAKSRPGTGAPTSMEITPGTHVLRVGWTQQASAIVRDENGAVLSEVSVKWRSSDTLVALVSKSGLITLRAQGTATIQAVTTGNRPIVASAHVSSVSDAATISAAGSGYDPGHTCALGATTGIPSCWGANSQAVLGLGTEGSIPLASSVPLQTAGKIPLVSITSGGLQKCGLNSTGQAYCWGENAEGQGGTGVAGGVVFQPTAVVGGFTFVSLSTGSRGAHTCGIVTGGQAYCWGSNNSQILGQPTSVAFSSIPIPVQQGSLRFIATATGGIHTCALTNAGAAYCWGSMWDGQLGNGIIDMGGATGTPTAVLQGSHRIAKLVLGRTFACGLTTTGQLLCWGYGSHLAVTAVPVLLDDARRYVDVAAGDWSTCLLDSSREAYCLGANNRGQLGSNVESYSTLPAKVETTAKFTEITVGGLHACGRTTTGSVLCWGENDSGALGDGTTISRFTPAPTATIAP